MCILQHAGMINHKVYSPTVNLVTVDFAGVLLYFNGRDANPRVRAPSYPGVPTPWWGMEAGN